MFHGVSSSLLVWITFLEVSWKMPAQLRATSVTLSFRSTTWRGLKMSCTPITSMVMGGLISSMATWMIFGTNQLIDNFCVKFPLLVWVSTLGSLLGSLFGSLLVTFFFRNHLLHLPVCRNNLFDQPVLRNCFLTSSLRQPVPRNCLSHQPLFHNWCVQNRWLLIG